MVAAASAFAMRNGTTVAQSSTIQLEMFIGAQTTDTLQKLVNDYNSQTPGVNVTVNEGSWETNSQFDTYSTRFQAEDSSFDIISMDVIWPPAFIENGWLAPLNDVFPASEQAKFLQAPIKAGTVNGTIYGMPWFHDSGLLYYRTDVLQYAKDQGLIQEARPPKDWTELREMAANLSSSSVITNQFGEMDGFVWQAKAYEGLMCDFMEFLGGTGQTSWLTTYDNGTVAPNLDTQNVKDALEFMHSLISSGASPEAVTTFDEEGSRAIWDSGDAIFHRNWPYAYALSLQSQALNGSDAGTGEQVFDVAPMPPQTAGDENALTSALGGWQLGLNAFSKHKAEAKDFMLWLTSEQQQLRYFAGNGNLPTRESAYNVTKMQEAGAGDQTYVVDFLPAFKKAIPRPSHPDYPAMSQELWDPMNSAVAGDTAPAAAATQMQAAVNKVLTGSDVQRAPFNPLWAFFALIAMGTAVRFRRRRK